MVSLKRFCLQFGEQEFKQSVEKIEEYVMAGDVMQVVASQRLSAPYNASPINLYQALRRLNPSPICISPIWATSRLSAHPRVLARLEDGQVTVRPIAGTRKRGETPEKDQAMEDEMLADPKEIAEHLMLIDLGRNEGWNQ